MPNKKLMIIDGSSLFFRAFYALPLLKNDKGFYTNAVYGFLTMFFKAQKEIRPDYIAVAFDRKAPTFRHIEYEEYKGNRRETPSELLQQFPLLVEILDLLGIVHVAMDGYEADDIAGTLSKNAELQGVDTILVTGDRDYFQLISDHITVMFTKKGITQTEIYDISRIREEYGLTPKQLIELKGLVGDNSDNIPGVKGIGEKTGLKLIQEFGTLDTLYEQIDHVGGKKLKEKLEDGLQSAFMSRRLGEILLTVPMETRIECYLPMLKEKEALKTKFSELQFKSLLKNIAEEAEDEQRMRVLNSADYTILPSVNSLIELLSSGQEFSFKFFTANQHYMKEDIFALCFSFGKDRNYIYFVNSPDEVKKLKGIFSEQSVRKIGFDVKSDIVLLKKLGINLSSTFSDVLIAAYLLDPAASDYSMEDLSEKYLNISGISEEKLLGKGKSRISWEEVSKEKLCRYFAFFAECIFRLSGTLEQKIDEFGMSELYQDIELPLVEVLADMEYTGFKIDVCELRKLGSEFQSEIERLTEEIYVLAGMPFNINSTKQLGEVLFEKLNLPVVKKTKTGYSTDVEVLETLREHHEIIEKILRYRQIVKLNSTYVDGLLLLTDEKTGRIHTKFNQTVTQTGRISSQDPNLQNIPVRTEDGRRIRAAFVSESGSRLVDADYSQIELRILAHISGDAHMIEAFNSGEDIHTKTASEVFRVPQSEVSPMMRSRAKAVNFGIVYGISDFGLSRDLGISRKEAKEYIENYLDNFNSVRDYMHDSIKKAENEGFVETLLHRRRMIPEIHAKNFNIRSFGERIAMNTPIQGTAADIIKMAMVKVYRELKRRDLAARMVLQIHDELIIETPECEVSEVSSVLQEIMESVISLKVPLVAEVKTGVSWYETK